MPRGGRRPGAGRKPRLARPTKTTFWLDGEIFERAKRVAAAKGTTIAEVLRKAIARLAGEKPKKPTKRR